MLLAHQCAQVEQGGLELLLEGQASHQGHFGHTAHQHALLPLFDEGTDELGHPVQRGRGLTQHGTNRLSEEALLFDVMQQHAVVVELALPLLLLLEVPTVYQRVLVALHRCAIQWHVHRMSSRGATFAPFLCLQAFVCVLLALLGVELFAGGWVVHRILEGVFVALVFAQRVELVLEVLLVVAQCDVSQLDHPGIVRVDGLGSADVVLQQRRPHEQQLVFVRAGRRERVDARWDGAHIVKHGFPQCGFGYGRHVCGVPTEHEVTEGVHGEVEVVQPVGAVGHWRGDGGRGGVGASGRDGGGVGREVGRHHELLATGVGVGVQE